MKKAIASTILAVACTSSVLFSGCSFEFSSSLMNYENGDKYTVGNGSVQSGVTELEIDWLDGNIEIEYGDVESVTFQETSAAKLSEEKKMHHWLEGSTLHLKCIKSTEGIKLSQNPKKELKVVLPRALALEKVDINAFDADVELMVEAKEVEIETHSGAVHGYLDGETQSLEVRTASGNVVFDALNLKEFDFYTINGDISLQSSTLPYEGEVESGSGNFTLSLYEGAEFSIVYETVSGGVESDFSLTKSGNRYVCGSSENEYEVKTVSGNLKIEKKTAK